MTPSAIAHRTDPVPASHLLGFDKDENVFLYERAATSTREAALFFPLESYYPDSDTAAEVPFETLVKASRDYEAYVAMLEGQAEDEQHEAVVAFREMNRQVRTHYYFNNVRQLLGQLMDGLAPDFVFENNAPEQLEGEEWADYKAAFFDATGLLAIADQIDMPRMAWAGGFRSFERTASPEQRETMERFAHPDRFDENGRFSDL